MFFSGSDEEKNEKAKTSLMPYYFFHVLYNKQFN